MQADEANQAGEGEWNETPETWGRGIPMEPPQDYASGPEFPQEPPQGAYEWFTTMRVVYSQVSGSALIM